MHDLLAAGLIIAVVALGAFVVVLNQRVSRLMRRSKRSLHIGPESHLRLQKQLYDRIGRAELAARGGTPRLPVEFRAEWGEDTLLYDLFEGQLGERATGVYVEVGALDGKYNSLTYVFEALGWTGLLVEPIPERFEDCRKNRPGSKVVHAALSNHGATGTTTFLVPDAFKEQLRAYRPEGGGQANLLDELESNQTKMREVTVPLMSMSKALESSGFDHVDFASIDVEGAELDVLSGFDLDRFKPRVLLIEDMSFGDDAGVPKAVEPRGYIQVLWIGANRMFVRTDDPALLKRAQRLAETVYSPFVRPPGQQSTAQRDLR